MEERKEKTSKRERYFRATQMLFETHDKLNVLSRKTGIKKYRLLDAALDLLMETINNREVSDRLYGSKLKNSDKN